MFKLKKLQELQNVVDKKIWTSADARFFSRSIVVCVCLSYNQSYFADLSFSLSTFYNFVDAI